MTERDFAYWLQGFFEASRIPLTSAQINCIRKHIALVKTTQKPTSLIIAIEGLLTFEGGVPIIRNILNAHFEHVIDPEHPNPVADNNAHGGSTLFRC